MFELVKVLLTAVSLIIVIKSINKSENRFLQFLIFAFWLRFALGAFHQYTYSPIIGPFSLTAFFSIVVAGLGFLVLPKKVFLLRHLLLFFVFFGSIVVSALYNGVSPSFIVVAIKWFYFVVITCCLYLSINTSGIRNTFKPLLPCFFLPISLQIASVVLGAKKVTDNEGNSFSYIGGYFHESGFSMILVAFLICLSLLNKKDVKYQTVLFLVGTIGIFLTNYRTAIIAVLPVLAIYFYSLAEAKIQKSLQPFLLILFGFVGVFFLTVFFTMNQERFADVGSVFSSFESLIKAPIYFTEVEKDLLSARVYIWSQYLSAFFHADFWTQAFGFGPESYKGIFEKYAHNTFVSFLYEFGYLGFAVFILINVALLINAYSIRNKQISSRVFYSLVGFLTLNLATMPLWALEGMIIYAILVSIIFSKRTFKGA